MSGPVDLMVIYSQGADGWVVARIREFPAAMSQGRTREEARANVLDALRELVFSYLEDGEGARHTIWASAADRRRRAPVPRHREIDRILARAICRQLGIPEP